MSKVSIIGSGSFGCALSVVLCDNGHDVSMWSFAQEEYDELSTYHTTSKLPGSRLSPSIHHTMSIEEAMTNKDLIVMAVPSPILRKMAQQIKPYVKPGQRIITISKGIEESTLMIQSEILEEVLPDAIIGVLCGPSHAEEVVKRLPTLVVSGSENESMALYVQEVFMNPVFRVYTSPDVKGMELGASLKNVIAIAAGLADGLGFGDNALAALITRGIKEISTLAVAMGASPDTLAGLCGVGDLIVTCQSKHSRNRRCGALIAQGKTLDEATKEINQVVEGLYSAKASKALGEKYNVSLPIIEQVNHVLFDGMDAEKAVIALMQRERKPEMQNPQWIS